MHRSRVSVMVGVVLALGAISPSSTLAVGKPEVFGPFVDTYTFIGFDCGDFLIEISGTSTTTFTASFDANGDVTRLVMRVRAPYDTLTNTTTGHSSSTAASSRRPSPRSPAPTSGRSRSAGTATS